MQVSVGEQSRRINGFMQGISMLVMAAMVCLSLKPLSAAAAARPNAGVPPVVIGALPPVQSQVPVRAVTTADDQYGQALEELKELVSAKPGEPQSVLGVAGLSTSGAKRRVQSISEKIQQLEKLDAAVDASFAEVGKRLDDKKLSKEIKARHQAAELVFKQKRNEMKRILEKFKAADAAGDEARREKSFEELGRFLASNQPGKRHKKLDPNKLPWRVSDGKARKPAQSPAAFTRALAGSDSSSRTALAPATIGDLSATDAVQITQAISDLAVSLGKNPVTIYNWVRNNIDYIPSFGSIQGSDATLSKKQGNAFDTASLLIALYRASGIPSRYVYGTIQVPADVAMNWVGGVTKPEAAQQLWAQGGVPNVALTNAGRITHIEIEHVWVEAWVDFDPSRGRKQGQGDTWVPLDASFKRYTDKLGLLAGANLSVDMNTITSAALTGATVNGAEGWVQNPNVAAIQSSGGQYLNDHMSYIEQVKPDATVGEVYGTRATFKEQLEILAASLPYKTVVVGARYSDLPSALTHKFRYTIYASESERSLDNPILSFSESLPNLAGRKVLLLYAPATQADAELIASRLPQTKPDGSQPTLEDLSDINFPAYLIRLRPEIRVDGVVRATGTLVTMGADLLGAGAFTELNLSLGWDETSDVLSAGQVTAIGLNMQGIDKERILRFKMQAAEAKSRIESGDFSNMASTDVGGDLLTTVLWQYFASLDTAGRTMRLRTRVVDFPALSFGLVHVDLGVESVFGVAKRARFAGMMLDIGHLRNIRWSMDNDKNVWVRANRAMGMYSSTQEHVVLEELLVTQGQTGEAASSAKLLAKAAVAGQRIYVVTQANIGVVLPQLELSAATLNDVQSAVASGKEVTIHQRPMEIPGWSGAGYVITDAETGAGAYLIEGGANGAYLGAFYTGLATGIVIGVCVMTALLLGPVLGWIYLALSVLYIYVLATLLVYRSLDAYVDDENMWNCYVGGLLVGFDVGNLPYPPGAVGALLMTLFIGWYIDGNAKKTCEGMG
ncbi:transglutaminase-like domain-containing protein [Archangium lansingense]|uniref:transglutaminase-like domain-containing protein n=1 Tax=Archangium lansingense TaxID=2995310 RepID=UPI003B7A590D